jgi:predicted MFS family arabinose efflux permease
MQTGAAAVHGVVDDAKRKIQRAAGGPARLQVILLLGAVLGLDTADKAAVSAVVGSLKNAFGIDNTQIGILIASVSFVGAIFTLPIGALVDRSNRKRILTIAIAIWTVAMVVSGAATSFVFLLLSRIFLGAVTAAAAPAVASLVGDFFPAEARAAAYGMILAGELVGMGVGFLLSGEASTLLGWRWSFYLMGIPGAAVGWVIWRYLSEPARGGQSWIRVGQDEVRSSGEPPETSEEKSDTSADGHPPETHQERSAPARELARQPGISPRQDLVLHEDPTNWSLWRATRYLLRIPTYRLLIIASTLGYYFFAGVRAFAMIYLTQHYHVPKSLVSALAIVIGIGAITGVIVGGRGSEWLLARGHINARIFVPGVSLFLSALLMIPAILTTNIIVGAVLLTFGTGALAAANPPIDAARLDIIHFGLWGRGEAGRMALRGALEGGAPILFGLMSKWFGGGQAGLEWTFLVMLTPVFVAASLAIPARHTYPRDVATADASIQATRRPRPRAVDAP